jgi:anti-anti-sigma factor
MDLQEQPSLATDWLRVTTAQSVNAIDLTLPESLDSDAFNLLNESMLKTVSHDADGRWVLDLSSVNYMGSSVLGLLINVRQRIKSAGGRLALCGLSPRLTQIFHTCCLEKLFTITVTRPEAIRAMGGR